MIKSRLLTRFIRPHRQDSRILVGFLALAGAMFVLIKLASEVAEGDTFALDKAILRGLRTTHDAAVTIGPAWLRSAMIDFTALGGAPVLSLIAILGVGYLLSVRKFSTAIFVTFSVSCGALLSALIKCLFIRPRPEIVPHLVDVSSTSFPSGHAMNSAIVYLTIAALLARSQNERGVQIYLMVSAMMIVLIVGATRIFLGVHWPSDVLAGWAVGALWAAICSLAAKALQNEERLEVPTE